MKITIEDDSGKQLTLETGLTVIPAGYVVLICAAADKNMYIPDSHKLLIERQFDAWGIKALVAQIPVRMQER